MTALVLIPNCDKIIPGMLMAASAPEYPCHIHQRRSDAGRNGWRARRLISISVFEGVGKVKSRR